MGSYSALCKTRVVEIAPFLTIFQSVQGHTFPGGQAPYQKRSITQRISLTTSSDEKVSLGDLWGVSKQVGSRGPNQTLGASRLRPKKPLG